MRPPEQEEQRPPVTGEVRAALEAWADAGPIAWSARAIMPGGTILELAGGLRSHRDALRACTSGRGQEYRTRYRATLYASCARGR